ncbi:type II secretion system protein N [Diaphorobacter ruginosibacter]|uniref:type II secretion system protein N n=1 Tax=Diaphorobacter ruginosibacter TaxID=1715720 RepID=UPI0031B5FAA1
MVTNTYSRWKVRAGTFILWFLAMACVVFWGLRLSAGPQGSSAPGMPPAPSVVDVQALMRLLGGTEVVVATTPKAAPTRYTLVGVLAGMRSGHGAALIEVDGKPAKPFRVGAEVADGLVVQSLGRREAHLGATVDGPASLTLQMPLKVASNGAASTLPVVPVQPAAPPLQPVVPQVQSPMMPGTEVTASHPAQGM